MSGWTQKRFWKTVSVVRVDEGHAVRLDDRQVKTPAKAPLAVPTRGMAEAIAAEWEAQEGIVDPNLMPVTRAANSVIDKVIPQFDEVAEMLASYGGTDLICYRAEGPAELIARQQAAWDPLVNWARELGAPLVTTAGIVHVAQPEESLSTLRSHVFAMTPYELAGFHDLVTITGSLVIALAVMKDWADPETLWSLSRVDEDYQAEVWGHDEEAAEVAALKKQAFLDAAEFVRLARL